MRRDRLLLVSAFAVALLTMLGAVGEGLGMDRLLKSNTSKTRSHSLFRQGCMLYELIPNMSSTGSRAHHSLRQSPRAAGPFQRVACACKMRG